MGCVGIGLDITERKKNEELAHLRNDREEGALSASVGIGIYPNDGRATQEILEAADQQLYRRKKSRRGRGTVDARAKV